MLKLSIYKLIISFGVLAIIIVGCSTEKDAALNIGYHNMTARFNGYFNAGEIINKSVKSYREKFKDDYSELLDINVYPSEVDATSVFPDMDLAIEKCSKVIYRHSMPNPNVVSNKDDEYCKWIDDNWFLIGKSHFLKREFDKAEEKFDYIADEYSDQSSYYAAEIWLAKLFIEQNDLLKARLELIKVASRIAKIEQNETTFVESMKEKVKNLTGSKYDRKRAKRDKKQQKADGEPAEINDKLRIEFYTTFADLYINEEDYQKASEQLIKAAKLSKGAEKARYQFILGQLFQKMEKLDVAEMYFDKVVKSNAEYEMRFYAKINKTLTSSTGNEELREGLYKMLKDLKNEEYKDQIYYVLAELDLKEEKRAEAISNLTKSAIFSVKNDKQKGKTYLKLADMHFEDRLYIKAQRYYDSCVNVLPKEHSQFKLIDAKAKSLSSLVKNYEIYVEEDSLQKIVALPEKEREKRLKQTLKEIKERERKRKADEQRLLLARQNKINIASQSSGTGSKWYFYNDKSISKGYNDFKLEWTGRKLEDNWRRSNKKENNEFVDIETDSTVVKIDSLTIDILRDGLPLSEESLLASKDKFTEAVYNLGLIYKNQLDEENEAINYFTMILDKKHKHVKVLYALYQLYLINKKTDIQKANGYKRSILKDYPDTDIAKLMTDPNYFIKKEEEVRKELSEYKLVLRDYEYQRYLTVITDCNKLISKNPNNKYINKYYLLKAKAISKTGIGGIEAISEPLLDLIKLSPDSEEGIVAKKYLKLVDNPNSSDVEIISNELYKIDKEESHFFIILIPSDQEKEINDIKIKVSNFNNSFFAPDNLTLSSTIIGNEYNVVMIKLFVNLKGSKSYNTAFKSNPAKSLLNNVSTTFESFMISKSNYYTLFSTKDIESYRKFYEENY